ncbi:MAG TPA: PIN domain-containing protein, partial [SAR324 cluster bacterium]|nr:PIN domain-containing protein [SAR324 cluster bacterium]
MRGLEVFVLDTNVLLFAPEALEAFSEAEVVIPINVIEELDRFKAELSDRGGSARVVSQRLDELRELGSLAQGVQLDEGGRVRVELQVPAQEDLPGQLDINRASNRVLAVAWELFQRDLPVTLVTQDTNLRVKANALEVPVMRYMNSASGANGFFEGMKTLEVEKELIHQLLLQDFIDPSELNEEFQGLDDFLPNEGLHLMNGSSNSEDLLAIYHEGEKNFQILERL